MFFMNKTIVFCGSFKFHQEMEKEAKKLRKKGLRVIVPKPSHIRHGHKPEELKREKYDKATLSRWEGEGAIKHLNNVKKADVVYIFNKGSYIGPAVTVEIGFALAHNKPIYAQTEINDITVSNFIKAVVSPQNLVQYVRKLKV